MYLYVSVCMLYACVFPVFFFLASMYFAVCKCAFWSTSMQAHICPSICIYEPNAPVTAPTEGRTESCWWPAIVCRGGGVKKTKSCDLNQWHASSWNWDWIHAYMYSLRLNTCIYVQPKIAQMANDKWLFDVILAALCNFKSSKFGTLKIRVLLTSSAFMCTTY